MSEKKKSKNVHHQKSFRLCIHFSLKKKSLGKPAGNVNTVPKCVCNRCTFSKQELKGMSSYLHSFFETTCINIFLLSLMFCWMSLDIVWMANKSQLPPEPEGGGYTTHLEWSVSGCYCSQCLPASSTSSSCEMNKRPHHPHPAETQHLVSMDMQFHYQKIKALNPLCAAWG